MLSGILGPQGAGSGADANISIQIGGAGPRPNLSSLLGQLGGLGGPPGAGGNSMPPLLQNMFRPPAGVNQPGA